MKQNTFPQAAEKLSLSNIVLNIKGCAKCTAFFKMNIIIFSIISAAYLLPNNSPPWNSFHSEFLAILFAITLGVKKIKYKTKISPYHLFALALIFFAACWTFSNDGLYKTYFFIGLIYLISSVIAFDYAVSTKNQSTIKWLFSALIFSSIITFGAQLAQFFEISDSFFPWVLEPAPGNRFFANFGQPNQLASLICVSFLGSLYLLHQRKISDLTQIIITICFSASLALAGSKTSILTLVVSMVFLFFLKKESKKYFLYATSLLLLFLIIKLSIPSATRDYSSSDISTGRIAMWKMLIQAILEKPWVGYGFNNTVSANFNAIAQFPESWHRITAHAHNLFLDFIIWFGVPIGVCLAIAFSYLVYTILFKQKTTENKLVAYSIIPLIIHANLEFPLHYAYFLIPLGFIAGAVWPGKFYCDSVYTNKILLTVCIALGTLITKEYFSLEHSLREQRFYLQNFQNSQSQKEIKHLFLDLPTSQYNFLVRKKITEENIKEMEKLVRIYPTYRNLYFLCEYFLGKEDSNSFNFYYEKAINILPEEQSLDFERVFKTDKNF